jgi:PAS domain S-box-containing protein
MTPARRLREPGEAVVAPADVAAALGRSTLVQLLTHAPDGIAVADADGRCVWANEVACRMLGRGLDEIVGRALPAAVLGGEQDGTALLTARLPGPGGGEHEVVYFTFTVEMAGAPHAVSVFRDLAEPRAAVRSAVALAQTVAQLARSSPTNEVLAGIARHAVEGTRALAAGISVVGADHMLDVGGSYGSSGPRFSGTSQFSIALNQSPAEVVIDAMTAGAIVIGGAPGKAVVLSDARSMWESCPVMAEFARAMSMYDWRGSICVPLAWENEVIGVLGVYLPTGMVGPSEAELAFCTTLADQAAIAVSIARLSARAGQAAAVEERSRLARELHDSVSQGLFAMTMHARAAELSLGQAGADPTAPLTASVAQLAELARGVLAEMRALIFELRPEALAEEGLVGALVKQAAALTAREQVSVTVSSPDRRWDLATDVEEHVYRIVSEALHNTVKHARATCAHVILTAEPGFVRVVVTDDGIGFDTATPHDGHLGLSTMAERALGIRADLSVSSRSIANTDADGLNPGTTLTLTVPVGARVR